MLFYNNRIYKWIYEKSGLPGTESHFNVVAEAGLEHATSRL